METLELIIRIKEERRRLLDKRPALEKERVQVLSAIDKAQFMTVELKEYVHASYDNALENLDEDIAAMTCRLKELGERNVSLESE